eukprot:jgi/Botrbrau1/7810/Bobra.0159s0238.1
MQVRVHRATHIHYEARRQIFPLQVQARTQVPVMSGNARFTGAHGTNVLHNCRMRGPRLGFSSC